VLKAAYKKAVACWNETVSTMKTSVLPSIKQAVSVNTDRIRALKFPYNDRGSDIPGAYAEAARNLLGLPAKTVKVLVLASDLVSTTSLDSVGSFSLVGVAVAVLYHTCLDNNA